MRGVQFLSPLVVAALVAGGFAWLGADLTSTMVLVETFSAFLLATATSWMAASAFERTDYLWRAWVLMGLCYALLALDTLVFGVSDALFLRALTATQASVSGVITLVANVVTTVSLVLVARAWRVAGLELPVSRRVFWALTVGLLAVALAVVGRDLLHDAREVVGGKFDSLHLLVSELGDLVATALLVPLLLTALSMRGGSLGLIWGLLTLSTFCWLGVDAAGSLSQALHLTPLQSVPVEEGLRLAATLLQVSAALAQRRAVT